MDYELFGHKPPHGRHWMYEVERKDEMIRAGTLCPNKKTGLPQYLIQASEEDLCNNLWTDISAYSFLTGYPTEKSEALLERVISMATQPGDLVLDSFAGSGTAGAVAEKLGRRWIGIDCGKLAIYTIQKRMLNLKHEIGNKGKPLVAKSFTVYNAGLYDFSALRQLPWADWRFFALQLFGCRDELHTIGGLQLDGKRQGASVLVFDHTKRPGQRIDEDTVRDIHAAIGKQVGQRFFIIAPRAVFDFQQDYIDLDGVRYYALRIPYSVINELHHREFKALRQPSDETAVNDTVDAVGFDFIQPPEVEWCATLKQHEGQTLLDACLEINTFRSKVRLKGQDQLGGFEVLSMVLLDPNYDGQVFRLGQVFYAQQLRANGWCAYFPTQDLGLRAMIVFMDIYGNESRVVISREQFVPSTAQPSKE